MKRAERAGEEERWKVWYLRGNRGKRVREKLTDDRGFVAKRGAKHRAHYLL